MSFAAPHFRRTSDSYPRFGDENNGQVVADEEVINGNIELQGWLPNDRGTWIAERIGEVLGNVAEVPSSWVYVSATPDYQNNAAGNEQAMKFHFVILPVIHRTSETIDAINTIALYGAVRPQFLDLLSAQMFLIEPHTEMFVKALQYSMIMGTMRTTNRFVWRPTDYRDAPPVLGPPDTNDFCSKTYTPCACAQLTSSSGCSWVANADTGSSSCEKGGSGVPCTSCADQIGCDSSPCALIADPCDCFNSLHACGWDEASSSCRQGIGTSCVSCARQSTCRTPAAVSFHPQTGSYFRSDEQLLEIGFDVDIKFKDASSGSAVFLCTDPMTRISIPRPRMTVARSYLSIDSSSLTGSSLSDNTNNARRCTLIIDEDLLSDSFGVAFLGLVSGQYELNFGDSLPPKVLRSSPPDGGTVQGLIQVTFTFSEPIILTLSPQSLTLGQLDDNERISSTEYVEATSSRVTLEGSQLTVDLQGKVTTGARYTLSLPAGVVSDLAENSFAGLAIHEYTFDVEQGTVQTQSVESDDFPMSLVIAIPLATVVVFGGIGFLVFRHCQRKNVEVPPAWDGESKGPSLRSAKSTASMGTSMGASKPPSLSRQSTFASEGQRRNTIDGSPDLPGASKPPSLSRQSTFASEGQRRKTIDGSPDLQSPDGRRTSTRSLPAEHTVIPGTPLHDIFVTPTPKIPKRSQTIHFEGPSVWEKNAEVGGIRRTKSMRETDGFRKGSKAKNEQTESESDPTSPVTPAEGKNNKDRRSQTAPNFFTPKAEKSERRTPGGSPPPQAEADPRSPGKPSSTPHPQRPGTSPQPDASSPSKPSKRPEPVPEAKGSPQRRPEVSEAKGSPQPQRKSEGSSPSRAPAWTEAPPPETSTPVRNFKDIEEPPGTQETWKDILHQLHQAALRPIADRKKLMNDYRLKYHPDKNPDPRAHEVMSNINEAAKWFLYESPTQDSGTKSKNGARRSSRQSEPDANLGAEKRDSRVPSSSPSPPEVYPRSPGKANGSAQPRTEADGNPQRRSETEPQSQSDPSTQPSRVTTRPRPTSLHFDDAADEDLKSMLQEVQQELLGSWDTPLAERKKIWNGILLKHHPDKQQSPNEKEAAHHNVVMQQINKVKDKFLHD